MSVKQKTMISLEELIPGKHNYRKFKEIFNFRKIDYRQKEMESNKGCKGYGMEGLFKCLLQQFMEDLSDRELEEALKTNCVAKWFCEFGLADKTRDQSLFGEVRKRIGTKKYQNYLE